MLETHNTSKPKQAPGGSRRRPRTAAKSARQIALERLFSRKSDFLKSFFQKEEEQGSRFYGGSEHSVFFVTRKTLAYVMRKQLLKHYLHLGLKKNQTHQGFKPFLLGFHNNISVVDITLLAYYLRRGLKFLLTNLLRNYRVCLISHQIGQYFNKGRFIFSYHMVFDY